MADTIPPIVAHKVSPRAKQILDIVQKFVEEECIPSDAVAREQMARFDKRWGVYPPVIDELKAKAKKLGLWNMFLSKSAYAEGFELSNLEYGLVAMVLAQSGLASEAVNCAAPDSGNMEVVAKYGTPAQKEQWLRPLLNGEIRSAFLMTEKTVASSDAKNIRTRIELDPSGSHYIVNGEKWWSSGAGDPRCKLYVLFGKSDPSHPDPYRQHSVLLVPADSPGIKVEKMLSVYGYDDAPHGHAEITLTNVRVPRDALVLGEGRGFEIIQGRLGPGRIHHAMRTIGAAEKALDLLITRTNSSRVTFGRPLSSHAVIQQWMAQSRLDIDAARLVVLNAALKIDEVGAKAAKAEIAAAKVMAPRVALEVIDRAVQAHGAAGVSGDTPLARMWAGLRTIRIADGPDEVHLQQMGRNENKRHAAITAKAAAQDQRNARRLAEYGFKSRL